MLRRPALTAIALSVLPVRAQKPSLVPEFSRLSREQLEALEKQRRFVRSLLRKHFPRSTLKGGTQDLPILQAILDAGLLMKDQTWELQALGVVFGDAIAASVPGLAWWSVADEFGTDPTLRYRESTLQVNAFTLISKRVERGEVVDVKKLFNLAVEHINKSARQYK
jgi:Domain of unknown function (DUF3806)